MNDTLALWKFGYDNIYQTSRRFVYYDTYDSAKAYYVNAKDRTYTRTSVNVCYKRVKLLLYVLGKAIFRENIKEQSDILWWKINN
jgi:hypothetical protein